MDFSPLRFFDLSSFPFTNLFKDIKYSWEALPKIESFIFSFKNREYKQTEKGIFVGHNVVIEDGAKILGPVIVGHGTKIRHAALVRNGCIIGPNVNIGHAVELKHSIILNNTAIAHLNYVGDSVVGSSCNISGGAILANWRFDKKSVTVRIRNKRIDTGMEKFGAVIGDNSSIGVNAVLNPGTIIGKNSVVFPLKMVGGVFEDNSVVK